VVGYWAALHEAGLPIDDELFVAYNMTTAGAYAVCQQLLARGVLFNALICANDESAIGATKALRAVGRHVPDGVSIIGFDDIDMAEHLTPALTTVRIHKRAIGAMTIKTPIARPRSRSHADHDPTAHRANRAWQPASRLRSSSIPGKHAK
jgi:DNA-binding LacI/PurR family transcriptional regulator